MRDNGPITNTEVQMQDDQLLVSKTDTGGRIVFINKAFLDISGFSEEELLGAPHNIVRHPHMPKEAFADMWQTIQAGRPWEGLVKNRTKLGHFYWVRANVTPVVENGQITGFMSIRSRPLPAQVAEAERLYAQMRSGKAHGISLTDGMVVKTGLGAWLTRLRHGIGGRMALGLGILGLLMMLVIGAGLTGFQSSNELLRDVYSNRTVPMARLASITDGMRDNMALITGIGIRGQNQLPGPSMAETLAAIKANSAHIDQDFAAINADAMSAEGRALLADFTAQRQRFLREGLQPAMALAERGEFEAMQRQMVGPGTQMFGDVHQSWRKLLDYEIAQSSAAYEKSRDSFRNSLIVTGALLLVAAIYAMIMAHGVIRLVRRVAARMENAFDVIARNDYTSPIPDEPTTEFKRMMSLLRGMRAKLGYSQLEKAELDRQVQVERRRELNRAADNLSERVQSVVDIMQVSSGSLLSSAQSMSDNACKTMAESETATSVTHNVTGNVQAVAAATQQLTSSITEIARQVSHANNISRAAVQQAGKTSDLIAALSGSAQRIGEVINMINEIAGQTNLLALNATIEAARAGEAGKGFAVVANEVKSLANQTSRATGDITTQVAAIQQDTNRAVAAIEDITRTIQSMDELSSAIAAAVEEQGAATGEIARSVEQAAGGTEAVGHSMAAVSQAAEETKLTAEQLYGSAEALKDVSRQLAEQVASVIVDMREG